MATFKTNNYIVVILCCLILLSADVYRNDNYYKQIHANGYNKWISIYAENVTHQFDAYYGEILSGSITADQCPVKVHQSSNFTLLVDIRRIFNLASIQNFKSFLYDRVTKYFYLSESTVCCTPSETPRISIQNITLRNGQIIQVNVPSMICPCLQYNITLSRDATEIQYFTTAPCKENNPQYFSPHEHLSLQPYLIKLYFIFLPMFELGRKDIQN